MPSLTEIIAKARGLTVVESHKERPRFQLPPPTERCSDCGHLSFVREPDQRDWSCLACELRGGREFPDVSVQKAEGWQGAIVGYE